MKKSLLIMSFLLFALSLNMSSCKKENTKVPVSEISLSKTSIAMDIGNTCTLIASLNPANVSNQSITWKSSNSDVATVSSEGVVTGIALGIATITVTSNDGNYSADCNVNVSSLNNGLVAYFQFNGNSYDASIFNNNGNYFGRKIYTADKNSIDSSSIELNGITDYIEVPNSPSLNPTNQLTINVWLNIASFPNRYTPVISKGGETTSGFTNREYLVYFNDQGVISIESSGDNQPHVYTSVFMPELNTWFQFTTVIDRINHKMQIYINGELKANKVDSYSTFTLNSSPLLIGTWNETNPEYAPSLEGKMDELRIYNRALTQDEITMLYQQ